MQKIQTPVVMSSYIRLLSYGHNVQICMCGILFIYLFIFKTQMPFLAFWPVLTALPLIQSQRL